MRVHLVYFSSPRMSLYVCGLHLLCLWRESEGEIEFLDFHFDVAERPSVACAAWGDRHCGPACAARQSTLSQLRLGIRKFDLRK